jgi:O-antigen ligase
MPSDELNTLSASTASDRAETAAADGLSAQRGLRGKLAWLMSLRGHDRAQADFERQFRRDAIGHRVNVAVACVMAFAACAPPAIAEWALWVPLAYALLRLTNTSATAWRLWLMPAGLCVMGLIAWTTLSVAWSPNPHGGWDEVKKLRFALAFLVIWPVIDQRRTIVYAIAAGMLAGNLSQIVHAAGVRFDIAALRFPLAGSRVGWADGGVGDPDRNGGWWHPLVGGSMLVAALGLHLPVALMGRGRLRVIAAALSIVTVVGILATGTRSALLGMMALVGITVLVAIVRTIRRRGADPSREKIPIGAKVVVAAAALMALFGAYSVVGERIERRVTLAYEDIAGAVREKDFTSDNGARLLMAWWSIEAVMERPIGGSGAGGYEAWCRQHVIKQGIDPARRRFFEHAHNAILHVAATTGLVGALLAIGAVGFALIAGFRTLTPAEWQTYDTGPPFALIGLVLVSPFDPIQFNTTSAFLLFMLIALCPWWRAKGRKAAENP